PTSSPVQVKCTWCEGNCPFSEDFATPRKRTPREQRVGAFNRSLLELFYAPRIVELLERHRAEIGRAEHGDVEREVGLGVGALTHPVLELPASVLPLADRVAHLEHERPARPVHPP